MLWQFLQRRGEADDALCHGQSLLTVSLCCIQLHSLQFYCKVEGRLENWKPVGY